MKVLVKVLMNREKITEAQRNAQSVLSHNAQQMGIVNEADRNILPEVEIPEPITEERNLYIDADKIDLAGENEYGMISVIYCGRDYQFVKTDELMETLEARFSESKSAYLTTVN